jgi:CHAT domain-containing protein/tetratricopeptide (TPR) repeat protein
VSRKNLIFSVALLIVLQPLAPIFAQARLTTQTGQPPLPESQTHSDKVNEIALKLMGATTEEERKSLLENEKDSVSEKLTQVLLGHARSYFESGRFFEALTTLHLAQFVAEQIGDRLGLAQTLTRAGNIYRMQGEYDRALEYLRKALPLHESLRNKPGIFNTLSSISTINSFTGDYDLELAKRVFEVAEEAQNTEWMGIALSQFAAQHFALGNYAQAFDYHQKSLKFYQKINNKPGIAFALHGIGNAYRMYGDYNRALSYFQKSLALSEEIGSSDLTIRTLVNLGALHRSNGDYVQAEQCLLASLRLAASPRIGHFSGNSFYLSLALSNLAEISMRRGDYQQALLYLRQSVSLSESSHAKDALAYALGRTAAVLFAQRDFNGALQAASRAAAVAAQTGGRDPEWRAHLEAGKAYRALEMVSQARQEFEKAIAIIESVRADVASNEARSTYFATVQEAYEHYIDLLMQLHKERPAEKHDALALQVSERARARSLLEFLTEGHADIQQGIDARLFESERGLKRQLNAAAGRQLRFSDGKHTSKQVSDAKKEVEELTTRLQELRAEISLRSPRYAALTQPVPLTLGQIQGEVLDPETALLEYSLGEERSYLWVVTSSSIKSVELPKRSELESSVRQFVGLLSDGQQATTSGPQFSPIHAGATLKLSHTLLPPALMAELDVKRLVVVGDGALRYLPFSALASPKAQALGPTSKKAPTIGRPLIADYELISLPSASTIAVLRREALNRSKGVKGIAVFADPVFEENDERVERAPAQTPVTRGMGEAETLNETSLPTPSNSRSMLERALRSDSKSAAGGDTPQKPSIARLPFTRFEANGIFASARVDQGLLATDFRASRATATGGALAQYRYLHFATHAILNTEHPELSGIVLSLVDEQGKQVDGFLRLHDIYNLNLPADLVVLSACQTGLGKEIRGEGLVGLTRGFMYAGAPRVVASLWKVDDAATAELMKRFYAAMLKNNLRPAAALRRAKLEMWQQKRWRAPFYWAAFELQGEWK